MLSRTETIEAFSIDKTFQRNLNQVWDIIAPDMDGMLDRFYERLTASEHLSDFFKDPKVREHARSRQKEHWQMLFMGTFDDAYYTSVTAVGRVHFRIDLPFLHYTAAYAGISADVQHAILRKKHRRFSGRSQLEQLLRVANDAFFIDIQAATNAYMKAANEDRDAALKSIQCALKAMADGELTNLAAQDQSGSASNHFNHVHDTFEMMRVRMTNVFEEIRRSAGNVRDRASSLEETSRNLSHRTQSQAASVEQASQSVKQMLEGVDSTEDLVVEVLSKSRANGASAEQGASVINNARDAMQKIQDASGEIATIVNVIDDISFQTNLLALNAGVEAARAGEAGRGFAVVASEVRGLAQRSADSASSIRDLISRSNEIVQQGSQLMEDSSDSLEQILSNAGGVAQGVEQIRTAASHQAVSLREIGIAISMIEEATVENAATAEMVKDDCAYLLSDADNLGNPFELFRAQDEAASASPGEAIAAE